MYIVGELYYGEYCEQEVFEAKCGVDEVIVVQSARYGRMRLGRCLRRAYGALGCGKDALATLHRHCSGRRECSLGVISLRESHRVCPADLTAFLAVTHHCVKGRHAVLLASSVG